MGVLKIVSSKVFCVDFDCVWATYTINNLIKTVRLLLNVAQVKVILVIIFESNKF